MIAQPQNLCLHYISRVLPVPTFPNLPIPANRAVCNNHQSCFPKPNSRQNRVAAERQRHSNRTESMDILRQFPTLSAQTRCGTRLLHTHGANASEQHASDSLLTQSEQQKQQSGHQASGSLLYCRGKESFQKMISTRGGRAKCFPIKTKCHTK